jgi:lipoate-protein ligase A
MRETFLMHVRVIPISSHDGYVNMALDEAVLISKTPTLRFYSWIRPSVSIGYFQKISEIDTDYLERNSIDLVRRITGGKGVYHWKEITYSLVLPLTSIPETLSDSCRMIAQSLQAGFKKMNIPVTLQTPLRRSSPDCFQSSGWYDLYVGGKKIAGSAQLRRDGMLLQQGSVLMATDMGVWNRCFKKRNRGSTQQRSGTLVTSLHAEVKKQYDDTVVAVFLAEGFAETLHITLYREGFTDNEKKLADKLARSKYHTIEWNYRR